MAKVSADPCSEILSDLLFSGAVFSRNLTFSDILRLTWSTLLKFYKIKHIFNNFHLNS
ncbi:hypothetical protein MC7420_6997 [Coleofasciculus chthonoplastes PCC 7420]|uniref:Uncharacterized protein n=1 Tax=Coleofasciculus chthonoplastes PCC 7420 TaxID=118168 RepID=B4VHD0_9CYAN|nr:hypothetical protein MC7420_6997 [Coleofasciculus chthonoplastes PCC 7420]